MSRMLGKEIIIENIRKNVKEVIKPDDCNYELLSYEDTLDYLSNEVYKLYIDTGIDLDKCFIKVLDEYLDSINAYER